MVLTSASNDLSRDVLQDQSAFDVRCAVADDTKGPSANDVLGGGQATRCEPRSSIFLGALLRAGPEQALVKVRNMSPNGALIESDLRPPPGTEVRLIRGSLVTSGTVAWRSESRVGLRLSSQVIVKDWLAEPSNPEQQRVDGIVALVKAGVPLPAGPCLSSTEGQSCEPVLADDLNAILSLMVDLEDDLVSCDTTLVQHAGKLQNLDIAMQMIRAIAQSLVPAGVRPEASLAKLEDLRVACTEALRSP